MWFLFSKSTLVARRGLKLSEVFVIELVDQDVSVFQSLCRRLYLNWQTFCEQFSVNMNNDWDSLFESTPKLALIPLFGLSTVRIPGRKDWNRQGQYYEHLK
jgi:hypothetical protein